MTRTVYGAWRKGIERHGKDCADLRGGTVELSLEMVVMVGVKQRWRKAEKKLNDALSPVVWRPGHVAK